MSDTNQTVETPPEFGVDETGSNGSNRRVLMIVGGAVAAVVLLAVAYLLLFSGGSGDDEALVQAAPHPTSSAKATHKANKPETLPATFDDKVGQDPFKPLAAEQVPVSEETETPTSAPTDTSVPPTTPTPVPTNTSTTSYDVTVNSVNLAKKTATVTVSGQKYAGVKKGDLLPDGVDIQFEVIAISSNKQGSYVSLRLGSGSMVSVFEGYSTTLYWTTA